MPEPSSPCPPMSICSLTTLGITLAATCSTEPAGCLAAGWGTAGAWAMGAFVAVASWARPVIAIVAAPIPPPTTAAATAPATMAPRRDFFGRSLGIGAVIVWCAE
jgi:hypothetical protein